MPTDFRPVLRPVNYSYFYFLHTADILAKPNLQEGGSDL